MEGKWFTIVVDAEGGFRHYETYALNRNLALQQAQAEDFKSYPDCPADWGSYMICEGTLPIVANVHRNKPQ